MVISGGFNMKKIVPLYIALILAFSGLSAAAKTKKPAVPEIKLIPEVWNFGKISQGDRVSYSFKVKNVGKADLVIPRLRSECSCTIVRGSTGTFSPGEIVEVTASFDAKNYRGPVTKHITVESNDPANPEKVLTLMGEVEPAMMEIEAYSKVEGFEKILSGDRKTVKKLLLRNKGNRAIKIGKIRSSSPAYKVVTSTDNINRWDTTFADIQIDKSKILKNTTDYIIMEISFPIQNDF
jgi:hypothetical protein